MTRWTKTFVCIALALAPAALAQNPTRKKPGAAPPAASAISLNTTDLKWGPAPPVLPKGAQMAVLLGDPTKPGLFAMRLQVPDGYKIAPHWHTQDEQLSILQGTFVLHMGDSAQGETHTLAMGGFHYLPGGMRHSAEAHGQTVIQINGWGPFDLHYVNPSDNPSPEAAQLTPRARPPRR